MKIKINSKEHNWYIKDLNNYTTDFLISIILHLYVKKVKSKK